MAMAVRSRQESWLAARGVGTQPGRQELLLHIPEGTKGAAALVSYSDVRISFMIQKALDTYEGE